MIFCLPMDIAAPQIQGSLRAIAVILLLWGLAAGPAAAQQFEIRSPVSGDLLIVGQSTPLSVTVPTSQTFSSYAEATLEVRLRPLSNADDGMRDEFEQSGMTVEFSSEFTSAGGLMVRGQDGMVQTVFGGGDDGEIRFGSSSGAVVGIVSPMPDQDSTFSLTVSFSREPQSGETNIAVPTFSQVSAIIAAMQIVIPSDSNFTGGFLLRLVLTGAEADAQPLVAQSTPIVELPLPEIAITPPQNSIPLVSDELLVVASATGAMSEVIPGDVACSGRRCTGTLQAYLADGCEVTSRQVLPSECVSVDEDGDGRPELPALYSQIVWFVIEDNRRVVASRGQSFYVAPVIGFNTISKVIPASNPAPINVELSLSPVPPGVSLGGGVTLEVSMNGGAVVDEVTFDESTRTGTVEIASPRAGSLTLTFSDMNQRNVRENYMRLTPADPDNADNYLYAVGSGVVEISELQSGLLISESSELLPQLVTSPMFMINGFSVTTGITTYDLVDRVTATLLSDVDASSPASVTFSGNNLTVAFDPGVLRDGDVVELALALVSTQLVSTQEEASTLMRSLLFPVRISDDVTDDDENNVPDDEQVGGPSTLQVYDEEGTVSSSVRVVGGGSRRLVLGAYALSAALLQEPISLASTVVYSAAFSPQDVRSEVLPSPPSYGGDGVFDFSVRGLDNPGDTVTLLIPLLGEARANARLSKYAADDDGIFAWNSFTRNEEPMMPGFFDRVWSASKTAGVCPALGASRGDDEEDAWRSAEGGLRSGDACLLLQIQDGGQNDADGLVNGVVYDPNAVGGGGGGGGGGGAMAWVWLILMALGIFMGRRSYRGSQRYIQNL